MRPLLPAARGGYKAPTPAVPVTGTTANVLGLSDQVPSRIVFLTDGSDRKVRIGRREIQLKRTTPRNMATAGRKSGTIIQAFRYLGRDHVDARVLAAVGRGLTDQDRQHIRRDLPMAPAWIGDHLRTLIGPEGGR